MTPTELSVEKYLTVVGILAVRRGYYCLVTAENLQPTLHIEKTTRKALLLCDELHNLNKANGQVEKNYIMILKQSTLSIDLLCFVSFCFVFHK